MASGSNSLFGSMGLHQNNVKNREISFEILSNRNIIDVFREFRNKYFGTPGVNSAKSRSQGLVRQYSNASIESQDYNIATLSGLPIYCKLMILSFLTTKDVCSISCTNRYWKEVCNDQLLWRELLLRDMSDWDDISDKSHPLLPHVWNDSAMLEDLKNVATAEKLPFKKATIASFSEEDCCDLDIESNGHSTNLVNFKALYIHSAFQRTKDNAKAIDEPGASNSPGFQSILKSWWTGGKTEQNEYIIFGPGMEASATSKIFLNMLWNNGFITTKGLLPGNRDGIGSGVKIEFKERVLFKLIAMYSSNARLRGRKVGLERLINSNFIQYRLDGNLNLKENEIPDGNNFILHESFRSYLQSTTDFKLIFVVNATSGQDTQEFMCNRIELNTVLNGTKTTSELLENEIDTDEIEHILEQNLNIEDPADSTNNSPQPRERPLLVLSCVEDESVKRLSCIQIAALLNLPSIRNRAWRVQNVTVSNLELLESGLEWLIKQN